MAKSRVGVVFNPTKIGRDVLERDIDAMLARSGTLESTDLAWFETTVDDPGNGQARAAVDDACDLVLAAGGDGTVRAVAESLAGTEVELGIVPQGTGNLLARNLGVPLNTRDAIERALTSTAAPLDIGWVRLDDDDDARAFVVMVGFGIDAHMLAATDDELKKQAGWLAYVEAIGRAATASQTVDATITLDGASPEKLRAHTVLIGNCGTIQGGIALLPDARPDDGHLDLMILRTENVLQWLEALRSVVWDNGLIKILLPGEKTSSTSAAQHRTATSVQIELASPQPFEIDGEEAGDVQRIEVTLQRGAVRVR